MSDKSSLEEITIRGLGVIDSATIEFGSGLTVLSGETGAGKTMVLTALSLILGGKADADLVRRGEERIAVSGKFQISPAMGLKLADDGAQVEDGSIIILRTVTNVGKSRALLGGSPTTATQISELAAELIEIHAQSSTARLAKPAVQREILDNYAENQLLRESFQESYRQYQDLAQRIIDLKSRLSKRDAQIAEISAFVKEFQALSPQPAELETIENEISRLGSVELLNAEATHVLTLLEDDEISIFNLMQQARKSLDLTKGKDLGLDAINERFQEILFNLQDLSGDLASYVSGLEADPVRFEHFQQRKAGINALLKKYGEGSDRNLAYIKLLEDGDLAQSRLLDLSGGDDRVVEMERELASLFKTVKERAASLSKSRTEAATRFSNLVTAELASLSMPNARLLVEVESSPGKTFSDFSLAGADEIRILFTSHTGGSALPLAKAASGGELSRVMLAIEVVLAASSPLGTYIFDEVDAGVGGKAAVEVGRRLARLAKEAQVIVVTHLAQVAVWADHHLVVRKSESGSVTQSDVSEVSGSEREVEIARMLSGQESSATAREHAAELLNLVRESMIS
ncbi:MAG: DNA repair protein RecN [Actinomycetes bacterium]